jgi:hypothetical protein
MVVKVLGGGSTPSSGMSTPSKRISFAKLPESYASTRPSGRNSSSKSKDKQKRRKQQKGRGKEESSPERGGWLNGWLTTGGSFNHGLTMGLGRQEERNWGGRMGTGYLDDWAV